MNVPSLRCPPLVLLLSALALPAWALDAALGDGVQAKLSGTVSFGTMIRAEDPSPNNYGPLSAARIGATPGRLTSNSGGADLNFPRNRPVSTVLKGVFDLDLDAGNWGVFLRAQAWHDAELAHGRRAYGNYPNGFQAGASLEDKGFHPAARFSNARLSEAYVHAQGEAGAERRFEVRVGRQTVNWGTAQFVGGGINVLNATDGAAQNRPGSSPEEARVPTGMAYVRYAGLGGDPAWDLEGVLQYEFLPNVLPGCGTFMSSSAASPTGCDFVSILTSINEPAALASGVYAHRAADVRPSGAGQYGLALGYRTPGYRTAAQGTWFRAYALHYHNRASSFRIVNPDIAGGYGADVATRLSDPSGFKYGVTYARDVRLYGVSFDSQLDAATRIYGELAYRPNQPLNVNSGDLIAAFIARSPTAALNLAKNVGALAPGAVFDGYDRYRVTTLVLGAAGSISGVLGAERLLPAVEAGWSHVSALPDPGRMRYGRVGDYGIGAVDGLSCIEATVAQKSCSHDGYVSADAWGYRLRLAAVYPGAWFGATVTPSLLWSHDVAGYAYDGGFLRGRRFLKPGLRLEWGKAYFAEAQYTRMFDAAYNLLADRSNLTLVAGARF